MKICPGCGIDNPTEARFCRSCGQPFAEDAPAAQAPSFPAPGPIAADPTAQYRPQPEVPSYAPAPQPVPPTRPAQPSQASVEAQAFGHWLLDSLKTPSKVFRTQVWWSFAVTVVTALIMSLITYTWTAKTYSGVAGLANQLSSVLGSSYRVSSAPSATVWLKAWVAFLVLLYVAVVIAFIGRKLFGDPISFLTLHDQFVQRLLPFAILDLVILLLSLIGVIGVSALLFTLGFLIVLIVLPGAIIATGENHRKLDSYWLWLIAIVIAVVMLLLGLMLAVSIGGSAVRDAVGFSY